MYRGLLSSPSRSAIRDFCRIKIKIYVNFFDQNLIEQVTKDGQCVPVIEILSVRNLFNL